MNQRLRSIKSLFSTPSSTPPAASNVSREVSNESLTKRAGVAARSSAAVDGTGSPNRSGSPQNGSPRTLPLTAVERTPINPVAARLATMIRDRTGYCTRFGRPWLRVPKLSLQAAADGGGCLLDSAERVSFQEGGPKAVRGDKQSRACHGPSQVSCLMKRSLFTSIK